MTLKERGVSSDLILAMYSQGLSILDVAEEVGLSRQRVHQILKKKGAKMRGRGKPKAPVNNFVCKSCKKEFSAHVEKRVFCSSLCSREYKKKTRTKEEVIAMEKRKREEAKARAFKYYHEVFKKKPDWSDIVKERNSRNKGLSNRGSKRR